jgi:hypothetical protein
LLLFVAVVATYDTEHLVYGMEEGLHRLVVGDTLRVVALYDALQCIRSLNGLLLYDVDDDPHAYYIQQAQNGLYAREAIFCHCLGISLDDVKNDKTIIE